MERAAFEMQYSPRFSDAVSAEIDELNITAKPRRSRGSGFSFSQ
jgi:hypothetical protein